MPLPEVAIPNRPPVASCALLSLLVATVTALGGCPDSERGGGARIEVWRRTAGQPERLSDGASVAPGDVIQLVYRAPGAGDGGILSVDGRGVVTEHLPPGPLLQGRVALDHAFELDDAPDFERFFLVIGSADDVAAAGEALGAGLALDDDDHVAARFELRKVGITPPRGAPAPPATR